MNGNTVDICLCPRDFACMNTGSNLDSERLHSFRNRHSAMDCARRTIKQHKKSISSGLYLVAPKASNFPAYSGVMGQQ